MSLSQKLFIKGAGVFTPQGYLPDATIEVREGMIQAIWPGPTAQPGPGDRLLDLGDQVILPGLVNAHTHAAMNVLRGFADDLPLRPWLEDHIWPAEAKLTPEDIRWGTKLALLEMISSGTTTFSDMYFAMDEVAGAVTESGMRAVLCRGLVSVGSDGSEKLEEAVEFFYRFQGAADGRISVWLGPHAPYTTTPEFLERVAQAASDLGTGVHIHLAETRGEVDQLKSDLGLSPVDLLFATGLDTVPLLAAHAVHLPDGDIRRLGELHIGIAHCPVSNLKLGCGMAPISRYLRAQIPVGLGSDGAASANTLDIFLEMKASAWGAKGYLEDPATLTAREVFRMATEGGARAVGLGEVVGRIQPGLRADLIGVDLHRVELQPLHDLESTLVYSATGAAVRTVLVDGEVLYQDGAFLTLDKEEILAKGREIAAKIRHTR